ncbi:MAG: hypothetical protein KGL42_15100 [Betaproteobacteria bacterium]|nr:hypothetical protein [Betaproteobacteria bacterium]
MSKTPFGKNPDLENYDLRERVVTARITWTANATPASQTIKSDNPGVIPYIANAADPSSTSADTGAGFGSLNNTTAPSTCGLLVMCGDASQYRYVILNHVTSASMTAMTDAAKGASSTGVTASYNIAAVLSCTGLDADANSNVHVFDIEIHYIARAS